MTAYEAAARASIDAGPEPDHSQRLAAAAELLEREHARRPHLEAAILACAGAAPAPDHRHTLRCVLVALGPAHLRTALDEYLRSRASTRGLDAPEAPDGGPAP